MTSPMVATTMVVTNGVVVANGAVVVNGGRKDESIMKDETLDLSLFLTPGFGVELERQLRRTYPGQAHFAGTGPVGAHCEHCCHLGYWRQHRNAAGATICTQFVGGCARFYALTGNTALSFRPPPRLVDTSRREHI